MIAKKFRSRKKNRFIKKSSFEFARKEFEKNQNLRFLLKSRFIWMKIYIKKEDRILEIGSGNGLIKKIIKNVVTSDIIKNPWVDLHFDMNKPKNKKKYDIIILNHSLHHCKNPIKLFYYFQKILKKKGKILINEPELSLIFSWILKICNHEQWNFEIDYFNYKKDKKFPVENNAMGILLFRDKAKFENKLKFLKIKKMWVSEFFIFINSGGNLVKSPKISLNIFFLNLINLIDIFLIKFFPNIFALNRSVVIQRID